MQYRSGSVYAMLAALALSSVSAAGITSAQAQEKYPAMTIKIYNNAKKHNIYPVLSTGAAVTGKWLQAMMQVPRNQLDNRTYEKSGQFRLYLNPTGRGIPPGGMMEVQLPLATRLTQATNGLQPNQFADWWGGGRIEIFAAPASDKAPPPELTALVARNNPKGPQMRVTPFAGADVPVCVSGCGKANFVPPIYHDVAGLKHNLPLQLTEYTLGAIIDSKKNDFLLINPNNVDYDVSYVDTAFMPVAMEPFDNDQVGYVGMITPVEDFNKAVDKFLANPKYNGWPLFVSDSGNVIRKLPSPLNVFGRNLTQPQTDLTRIPSNRVAKGLLWEAMQNMVDDYVGCVDKNEKSDRCDEIRTVETMFGANIQNYNKNFNEWKCDPAHRVSRTTMTMVGHIYGWAPFNDGCGNAELNLLEKTPGYSANQSAKYREVKQIFDDLQAEKDGRFDPYAMLIHSDDYIGAKNVYAYSVDDALGNMQVEGSGLIIAVGGNRGLPNGDPATPPIHVALGSSDKDKVKYTYYRICNAGKNRPVNPDYTAFEVSISKIKNCLLTLWDDNKRVYQFKITQQPPFPEIPKWDPKTAKMVDCSPTKDDAARQNCERNAFGYTLIDGREEVYTVSYPAPVQPADPKIDFGIGFDQKDAVKYTRIGICSATPNETFTAKSAAFSIGPNKLKDCVISLRDSMNRDYQFQVRTNKLPFPAQATNDVIDCSGNTTPTAKSKCAAAIGYSVGKGDQLENKVIFPAPDQS